MSATPSAVKAICAAISVVTSTAIEASVQLRSSPPSMAARAPKAMPATCENGNSSPAASRTNRAQTKTRHVRTRQGASSAAQAAASKAAGAADATVSVARLFQPSRSSAPATGATPTKRTVIVAPATQRSAARTAPRFMRPGVWARGRTGGPGAPSPARNSGE